MPADEYLNEGDGKLAVYHRLWQRTLLVTPGDIARFVHLPGLKGGETAVSIYQDTNRKDGKPGGYWLTVTQASVFLWDRIPQETGRSIDPKRVTVERCDLPLPVSTALAVHRAWLAMLEGTGAAPTDENHVDNSTEIYFATNSGGAVLRARSPNYLTKNTSALLDIANRLIEHCNVSPAEQAVHARKIEEAAAALLQRLAKK